MVSLQLVLLFLILATSTLLADEVCVEINKVCVEGPSTKNINGQNIYKECWQYSSEYSCYDDVQVDTCGSLESAEPCEQTSSECLAYNSNGDCISFGNDYICSELQYDSGIDYLGQSLTILNEEINDSSCDIFESNSCSLLEEQCTEAESTKTISGLEVYRDCWKYQRDYQCVSEEFDDNCEEYENTCDFKSESCLSSDDSGSCAHYERLYKCTTATEATIAEVSCSEQSYCIGDSCSQYTTQVDPDFHKAAAHLEALDQAADQMSEDELTTFSGEGLGCSKSPFGFSNCCKDQGWGNDASLASCSPNEQKLGEKQNAKTCHYIGSFCSNEIEPFGICMEKTMTFCCFGSKLSRIIHEQGRGQLGIGWGSPEGANCRGLTVDELQQVNFDEVDFSEMYSDIEANMSLPDYETNSEKIKERIAEYYQRFEDEE